MSPVATRRPTITLVDRSGNRSLFTHKKILLFLYGLPPFLSALRPPLNWRNTTMQSWQRDETHGNVLRTLWFVALGNPTYWVACLVLAHYASHVLLGWPDGSLVWILTTIFEKAVSHRLSSRRVPTDTYPPRDPRRRAPVSFGGLTRDLVVLCRQYFIPGEEDFLKLARQPVGKISSWKWNPTQGIPLGETAPPPILGRPKRVVEWPSFRFLVVTLDNKISTLARLFLTCSRCGVKRRVSHFVRAENEMLTAQVTGSAVGVAVCCSDWGLECDRPKESRILAPPMATTPTSAPPALRSSLRQGSGSSNLGDFGSRRARVHPVPTCRTAVVRRSIFTKSRSFWSKLELSTSRSFSLPFHVSLGFKLVQTVEIFAEVPRRGDARRGKRSAQKAEEFRSRSRLIEPLRGSKLGQTRPPHAHKSKGRLH